MNNEIQKAQNGLKIQKAVLECEKRMDTANPHKQTQEALNEFVNNQKHGISFYLEKHGYKAELFECSVKDEKFSWLNKKGVLYIQVSEPKKNGWKYTAWFVKL